MVTAAGFLLGGALAVAAVAGWRVPAGDRSVGADVVVVASSGRALELPAGNVVQANSLHAGKSATGRLAVRNASRAPLAVRLRARSEPRSLDRMLHVELRDGATRLYRGPLGRLRRPTAARFLLAGGEERSVRVRAWLPADAHGYRRRIVKVTLEAGVERKAALR